LFDGLIFMLGGDDCQKAPRCAGTTPVAAQPSRDPFAITRTKAQRKNNFSLSGLGLLTRLFLTLVEKE
jgi:hypothetical protein